MFDIGWPEMMVIGVLTIIVVGPKELPRVMRTVMGLIRKVRMMAGDFQSSMEDIAREADLADIKKQVEQAQSETVSAKMEKLIDPDGSINEAMKDTEQDMRKTQENIEDAAKKAPSKAETS
ncbi:Sec-independent protein translocase protein TatB [Curvivirga aplysinae]|uniref:Sec-independent protein translocase protein TatB n=1 Tax=Curvivirga aplysinae TaxID=2529852 RepID=UPI0012BCA7C4|nr:Sec-independent protein translocase protein TatB [Curvivirga aplysinae]MTI10704.1 twin-arginine translocase subunit TatB [Curvivirga aplysinae]